MICPDCGGKKYRRNAETRICPTCNEEYETHRLLGHLLDCERKQELYQRKEKEGRIRRAAALGDKQSIAMGLEPWPTKGKEDTYTWWGSILRGARVPGQRLVVERWGLSHLPKKLVVSFATDVAESVLPIVEGDLLYDRARLAIEAAREWVDRSDANATAAEEERDILSLDSAASSAVALLQHTGIVGVPPAVREAAGAAANAAAAACAAVSSRPRIIGETIAETERRLGRPVIEYPRGLVDNIPWPPPPDWAPNLPAPPGKMLAYTSLAASTANRAATAFLYGAAMPDPLSPPSFDSIPKSAALNASWKQQDWQRQLLIAYLLEEPLPKPPSLEELSRGSREE